MNDRGVKALKARVSKTEKMQKRINELEWTLAVLVGRIDAHWDLVCSGTQNGIKTALLKEATEILTKTNK